MNKYQIPQGSLISFMSNQVKEYGGINLAQGIPGFEPPKELKEILSHLAFENIHQYAPGIGNSKLLGLINDTYKTYFPFDKSNFLVVQGATEAISLLYTYIKKLLNRSFSTLAFDPAYESYKNLPGIFNDQFIPFAFEANHEIDFKKLEKSIVEKNVKIVFIGSPGNPFGKSLSNTEVNSLIELSQKLNFYIIFDAVYKDIYFSEKPYIPLENFNKNLFYVNSFSKMLSITGWRIGYLIAHKDHMQEILSIHDYIGLCAPSILQEAIATYLEENYYGENYLKNLRTKLKFSFDLLSQELKSLGFEIPNIHGGYFIWAKLPNPLKDGFKFTIDLYEKEKVAVIPGIQFSERYKNYIRFNIAREKEEIITAAERIRKFIRSYN